VNRSALGNFKSLIFLIKFNFQNEVTKNSPISLLSNGAAVEPEDKNTALRAFREGRSIRHAADFSKYHEHACFAEYFWE
jgi:hypothetical protein